MASEAKGRGFESRRARQPAFGVAIWIALAIAIPALNALLMGAPGILLFLVGDAIATAILGESVLPRFHGDEILDVSMPMSVGWPVGGLVLWLLFAAHRSDRAWRAAKWAAFAAALLAWNVALAAILHLRFPPKPRVPLAPQAELSPERRQQQADDVLCMLAAQGRIADVRHMLEQGVPANAYSGGRTLLMCATRAGQLETMKALLEAGADPNRRAPDGATALAIAIEQKNEQAIELLRARGAGSN